MPTFTLKLPSLLRRAALLLPLCCLSWLAQAQSTVFNAGSLSYATTGAAGNRQVQFRVRQAYTILTEFRNPIVVGGGQATASVIDFGDGTAPEPVTLTVLSKGSGGGAFGNSYFTGEYNATHTYAAAGTYTATIRGGGRDISMVVGAGAANDSMVPTPVPFVVLDRRSGTVAYQVPASDPNGDALTYSLATSAETGGLTNPPGLSIDPRTGLLRFIPAPDADAVRIYMVVVKVSDGTTSTLLYQRLDLVGRIGTNTAPVITAPFPASSISLYASSDGKQVARFTIRATDADAGDVVTLRATGLPPGATLTPAPPASGNPVEIAFFWMPPGNTPDARYPMTFTAEDSRGAQTSFSFVIEFHGGAYPAFVAPTPADKQGFVVAPGQPVRFTVRVQDLSGLFETLLSLRAILPLPPGASLTPTVVSGNFAESTFSWTPGSADVGTYNLAFEAVDREDAHTYTGVTIIVRASGPACDPAASRPVAGTDQLSTSGGPLTITPAQLLANDTDPQGRPLKVSSISALTQGRGTLVANADGTFTFTPAPGFTGPAGFTYALDLNTAVRASRTTGHYYEFISAPGLSWTQALQRAGSASYQGMSGYLATITSAAEKDFLAGRNGASAYWFGAADDVVEGEWRWKAGPEAGQLFWRGAADGTALAYANWASGEPNDFKNQFRPAGEDYAQLYGASGFWNDLSNGGEGASVAGYVIEYGGLETCTPVLFATGTVTIQVGPAQAAAQRGAPALAAATQGGEKATLDAMPNPSAGQFRLRVTAATDDAAQLDMYDMQGRRVKAVFAGHLRAGEVRELAVDAPELAAGLYLVRLQTGRQVQQLRIVVQK